MLRIRTLVLVLACCVSSTGCGWDTIQQGKYSIKSSISSVMFRYGATVEHLAELQRIAGGDAGFDAAAAARASAAMKEASSLSDQVIGYGDFEKFTPLVAKLKEVRQDTDAVERSCKSLVDRADGGPSAKKSDKSLAAALAKGLESLREKRSELAVEEAKFDLEARTFNRVIRMGATAITARITGLDDVETLGQNAVPQ